MPVVALTGNYGMGKSTIARFFREVGAITLDLDAIVDELLRDNSVIKEIRNVFGNGVFSGKDINREKIAEIVFSDKEKRDLLERIIHPLVIERMREFLKKADRERVIIVEIPLLFEKGYENEFDKIITVYTDIEIALKRLENRGVRRDQALMRLRAQMPVDEKVRKSDFVIDNNGMLNDTKRQVIKIYDRLRYDNP